MNSGLVSEDSNTDWTATDVFRKPLFIIQEEFPSASLQETKCPTPQSPTSDLKTTSQNVTSSINCNTSDATYQPVTKKKLLPESNCNSIDFSKACLLKNDYSTMCNKGSRHHVLKEKNCCVVNFEDNELQDSTIINRGIVNLHKAFNMETPFASAEFSKAFTTQESVLLEQAPCDQPSQIGQKVHFTNAFVSSENTSVKEPQCSELKENEMNCTKKSIVVLEIENPDSSTRDKSSSEVMINLEDALIKQFGQKSFSFAVPESRIKKSKHYPKTSIELLPKKPNFPKFDRYINDSFYKHLLKKMEPKYGLKTNNEVVRVAEFVHEIVSHVLSTDEDCHDEANQLEYLLARKQIITSHFDFWRFCVDYLPSEFYMKTIPMMETLLQPVLSGMEQSD